jgi:hypothetical protein
LVLERKFMYVLNGGAPALEPVLREGEFSEPVRSWPDGADGGVRGREPELERFLVPVSGAGAGALASGRKAYMESNLSMSAWE